MSRWFLVALAIAFFVCLAQAAPAQEEQSPANRVEEEITKALNTIKDAFENLSKDPKIQEALKTGQEWAQNAAKRIQEEANKLVPKTEDAPAA